MDVNINYYTSPGYENFLLMLAEELHNLSCLVREHVGTTLAINNNDRGTRLVKKTTLFIGTATEESHMSITINCFKAT